MGRKKKEKRKFEVGGHVLVCGEELPYSEFWYSMKKEIRVPVSDFLDACMPGWREEPPEKRLERFYEIVEVEKLDRPPWRVFRLPDGTKLIKLATCTREDSAKGLCEKIGDDYYSWAVFERESVKRID